MGPRGSALLGFVLLVLCRDVCSAAQNELNVTNDESLNQIPQQQTTTPTTTSEHTAEQPVTQTGRRRPLHSYQLRSFQLVTPATDRPWGGQQDALQGSEELTPDQLESRKQAVVKFERRVPAPADSVDVRCGESEVTVQVKQNFLGNSQLIQAADLTLGGCAARYVHDRVLLFQAEMQACGSALTMTDDALVYTFSLLYRPTPIGSTYIIKTNPAEVIIECHYLRRRYVSSDGVRPTWKPFAHNVLAEQQLHFSLRLLTEDGQSRGPSGVYQLGDTMQVEASVLQGHHGPLRVHVDACVAAASPDPDHEPRYTFISNHGCFSDAKLTGAKSYFMQRSQEDKLRFQLRAFKFHQDPRNSLYITCRLKATTLSVPIDAQNKACSYLTEAGRWVASGGDNRVCSCCETSCSERRRRRSLGPDAGPTWEGVAALGPVLVLESILQLEERSEVPSESSRLLQAHAEIPAPSRPAAALLCGGGVALAVLLTALVCGVVRTRANRRSGRAVCT